MPDAGAPPLLEITIRRKQRGQGAARVEVIDNLAFALPTGDVTCLFGPSGCGKTTALRIVLGLDAAFEGEVVPPSRSLKLGVVFQDPRLLPWRTIADNVAMVAPALGAGRLEALLDELGLGQWRAHRPNQLSLGMQRRVALARALAVEPDLLVLDEAFVSLDAASAAALRATVFAAVAARRATVLMVTHDLEEALSLSDHLLILAPRPTKIVASLDLDRPPGARDASWLQEQRARVAHLQAGLSTG